jgi:hypothetical protein
MPDPENPFGPIEADWLPAKPAPRKHETGPCNYAVQFSAFAAEILDAVKSSSEQLHINRAKLLIAEQYMRLRRTLPAAHRDKTSRHGHYCIYNVLIDTWDAIEKYELRIAPPSLSLTAAPPRLSLSLPPPESQPEQLDGVAIGRLILGENDEQE